MNREKRGKKQEARNKRHLAIFILIIVANFSVSAQKTLKDTVIVDVVKSFQPTISDAFKINENPSIADSTKKIPQLDYAIRSKKMDTPFDIDPIKPAKMLGEPLTKLYRSLLKGGFGNYTTPYGEFFFNNLRSKEYTVGAHLKHISSTATLKDLGFSGYSDNIINLYGKKFLNKQTLKGDINYTRNVVHRYGYKTLLHRYISKEEIRQRFSYIGSTIGLMSHYTDSSKINHDLNLSYYNLSDAYTTYINSKRRTIENNVKLDGVVKTYYNQLQINVGAAVDFYNYKTPLDTVNNTILNLSPSVIAKGDNWKANIGLKLVEDIYQKGKLYFYPDIYAQYNIVENFIIPYAGITGNLVKNSFKSLSDANPFIISNPVLQNSNHTYDIYGGVRGSLSKTVSFNTKIYYSQINAMPFFVTTNLAFPDFRIVYEDVRLFNIHGELGFQQLEKLRLSLKGDFYRYEMPNSNKIGHLKYPSYKPQFELTLAGRYNIKDKIIVKADVFVIGNQFAAIEEPTPTLLVRSTKELQGVADINIGLEYNYTKRLTAFINFNNIGNFKYYRWDHYPTQGFNLLGGVSVAF